MTRMVVGQLYYLLGALVIDLKWEEEKDKISSNKFIWIDCNNKFSKVHFIKSKKIDDVIHNSTYVSLLN